METAQKLKASLKEVEDLKAALDEHAIVAITDPQGRITYVNDKFCAISKYSREELLGQDHRLINSDHHPAEFIHELWTTITNGKVWHGEIKNKAKDGSFYWVDTTIVPFLNDQRKPRQYVAIRADITQRKRTEEVLRQQLALFDQTYDAVIVWTWNGPITFWNRGAENLYGFSRAEAVGKVSHELLQTRFPDGLEQSTAALEAAKRWEGELEHTTRDGRKISIETRMALIHEPHRSYVLEANRDITERKLAEKKIRELNAGLEQRIIERTAQLEAANKELEAFSYSVSHDLRAPLRAVDGYIRMLQEDCAGKLDAEGDRLLEVVSGEAKRMGQLIDDLLAFSRLGRAQMKREAVEMTDLALSVFENLVRRGPAPLPYFVLKPLLPAAGDSSMLRQVLVNLIGNAIKFSRHQPAPVVEIGSQAGADIITYHVKDNGVGFDEKYAHKLFGVFQRLHSEDEFEGTGVGLALVQRIIQRHGGKVWAEARPNQGATFYFSLPTPVDTKGITS